MARILIAEDEDSLRSLIARALMQDGHDVVAKCDGGEALDCLTRENGRFDLLLTDIRMPVMDGIALALAAEPRLSGGDDSPDDRLCRPARTRLRLVRAHPRRDHQAVFAWPNSRRGERGARRIEGDALSVFLESLGLSRLSHTSPSSWPGLTRPSTLREDQDGCAGQARA